MNVASTIELMSDQTMALVMACEEPELIKELTRSYKQQTCLYGFLLGRRNAIVLHENIEKEIKEHRKKNLRMMQENPGVGLWRCHYADDFLEVLLKTRSRTLHGPKGKWDLFLKIYSVEELLIELWDVTGNLQSPSKKWPYPYLLDNVKFLIKDLMEFYKVDNAEPPMVGETA